MSTFSNFFIFDYKTLVNLNIASKTLDESIQNKISLNIFKFLLQVYVLLMQYCKALFPTEILVISQRYQYILFNIDQIPRHNWLTCMLLCCKLFTSSINRKTGQKGLGQSVVDDVQKALSFLDFFQTTVLVLKAKNNINQERDVVSVCFVEVLETGCSSTSGTSWGGCCSVMDS